MNTTSLSLLDRLKQAPADGADWRRLDEVYRPLIRRWLSALLKHHDEADDLTQEVLVILVRELPAFERRRQGSFRAWLRQITVNRVRAHWKSRRQQPRAALGADGDRVLAQLEDPNSALARQWDQEHDRHVFQKLLAIVQADFDAQSWQAFTRFALDGQPAADVARDLALSERAVIQAKFRILKRLREEGAGLIE
jgi:RNA polymerase sigma-70 factor (ECF subfamily)